MVHLILSNYHIVVTSTFGYFQMCIYANHHKTLSSTPPDDFALDVVVVMVYRDLINFLTNGASNFGLSSVGSFGPMI